MRCDTVCIWLDTPGAAQVSIPCSGCCHGGAEHQMQVDVLGHLCLSSRYLYTPWRLVMRATLLCRVAHTGPCMEYMRPHMPLKQGAYEHVRIRYVLRARTVALAPYIGNPAASLLSSGQHADSALPSRMYVQAMVHAGSPLKRGRSKERNSLRVSLLTSVDGRSGRQEGPSLLFAFRLSSAGFALLAIICPSMVPSMASPQSGTARSLLWRACSCRTPVYRGRQRGCILETVPRICTSCCLAKAAYPREAKDQAWSL